MMDENRLPGEAPRLAEGDSANGLMRLAVVTLIGGALCVPFMGAAALLLPSDVREAVALAIFAVILGFCAVGLWASFQTFGAIEREREAGYTTLYGRYRELWQLDHRTGEVLRRPGEREVRRRPRDEA